MISGLLLFGLVNAHAMEPELADAIAIGNCTPILAQLSEPSGHEERMALAWCAQRRGDHERAVAILEEPLAKPLGQYARWIRAQSLVELSRTDEALKSLQDLALPGDAEWQVPLLRGKALVLANRSLEARPDLRSLLSTKGGIEARYWLAKGGEDRGELPAAIATYQRVWTDAVDGDWANLAKERLVKLNAMPSASNDEGRALIQTRIQHLNRAHHYKKALALLNTLNEDKPPSKPDEWLTLARARALARDNPSAVAAYQKALGPAQTAKGSARNLFRYALAISRTGDYDTAKIVYGRVIATHPTTDWADYASFKLGYLEYDRGNLEAAIPLFEQHVKQRPQSKRLDDALWFLARCLWRNDQAQKADTAWKDLIRARPRSTLVPGAKYWRARVLGLGGDHEGEKAALQDILKRHPISGHAWFAALRVGHQFEPIPHAAPPQWPASLATRPEVIRSEVLLKAGFRHWARAELVGILPAAKASGRAGALAAAWKLNEVGAYRAGKSLAKPYCTSAWRGGDPVAQQACTPMPEATIVERLTRQHGLVPYLPYGIMVAESALKPEVTSIAGARGLMQLMPAVAERLHTILYPDRAFVVEDLYSAPYNASLGTTELGHRTASLKDTLGPSSLPAVIASYNGGEKAVRRWIDALGDTNQSDEFAEDIGYTETRKYVRRVLGTIMAYRWTYGDPPQAKPKPSCTPTPSAGEPCEAAALCPLPGQWHSYLECQGGKWVMITERPYVEP